MVFFVNRNMSMSSIRWRRRRHRVWQMLLDFAPRQRLFACKQYGVIGSDYHARVVDFIPVDYRAVATGVFKTHHSGGIHAYYRMTAAHPRVVF